MIVILFADKFSEDIEPSTIYYLAGAELLFDAFFVVFLICFANA